MLSDVSARVVKAKGDTLNDEANAGSSSVFT